MTIDKQQEIAQAILNTGLVKKVYHSCEMLQGEGGRLYPAYPTGSEYIYVGMDDRKELFAYIRFNGDAVATPFKKASCENASDVRTPLRVVFFSDSEDRDRNFLTTKLSSFTFVPGVILQRIITDKYKLVREESDVYQAHIDGHVFYMAVDVLVKTILLSDTCNNAQCEIHQNPITL